MPESSGDPRSLPVRDTLRTRHEDWDVRAINFLQAVIGCVHGFVPLRRLAADASRMGRAVAPGNELLLRGAAIDAIMRIAPTPSSAEARRLVGLMSKVGKMNDADVRAVVAELRVVTHADIRGIAVQIRDHIDKHYTKEIEIRSIIDEFAVDPRDAEAAFNRQFSVGTREYQIRRRVEEAVRRVRVGDKVDSAARDVGWKGKRHLYDHVRKLLGTTPAGLRSPSAKRQKERQGGVRGRRKRPA